MVKIPLFPSYLKTQLLIKCLIGNGESEYKSMWNTIWNLRGTPQALLEWQKREQKITQ